MRSIRRTVMAAVAATALTGSVVLPGEASATPLPRVGVSVDPAVLAAGDTTTRFVVVFEAKADVSAASRVQGFDQRGSAVVQRLIATSNDSQAQARALVRLRGGVATSYWVRNTMVVDGDADLAAELATLPGVAEVRAERVYPLVEPVAAVEAVQPDPVSWGVQQISAVDAWNEGVLGGGVVVGTIDTGVDGQHPALVEQYRGNLGGGTVVDDYNWFDPTGVCGASPCDNVGHGTHTMGTIVGGDGPGPFTPDIGVAPGARWIAAKGCEDLGCSESALLASGQFMLAPTDVNGDNPDPTKRPDIVSNSWGSGPGDAFYQDMVSAWRAAGMIPVFSSGNPGPDCGAGGSPGDYLDAISVGATDASDVIADFSGRGPSIFGKSNPDVSAPGVDVVSSIPGGGYEALSGTSMAAPHVAGTLALMLSAAPGLIGNPDSAQSALEATALDIVDLSCGGDDDGDPNNVYGEGRIDALAAVDLVASGGTVSGVVTDAGTGTPLGGVRITATNDLREFSTFTDADGRYELLLAAGPYTVSASLFGYASVLASGVVVVTDQTVVQDLALDALPTFTVDGRVVAAENGAPLALATVTAIGTPIAPVQTDGDGNFSMVLPQGAYTIEARSGGCTLPDRVDVDVSADVFVRLSSARKIDDFGHGCSPRDFTFRDPAVQSGLFGDESYGRLRLPFDFPFYDQRFSQVFVSTNGVLTFVNPTEPMTGPGAIPSAVAPNALIAPMWGDLVLDEESSAGYRATGEAPDRIFTVSVLGARTQGSDDRFDYQVRLWEDGTIDMIYRGNGNVSGDGSRAAIGLESPDGRDGFAFSSREAVVGDGASYRFQTVPTGVVSGVVTNANDGLPVAGAVVTAEPGGRSATTDADGHYDLRLVPGSYSLSAAAEHYMSETRLLRVRAGGTPTADFVLTAPQVAVGPATLTASADLGETAEAAMSVTNTGTAPLTFQVRERDGAATPVTLPPAAAPGGGPLIRPATWDRFVAPAGSVVPSAASGVTFDGPLETIVDDPDDDAVATPEITALAAGSDGTEASFRFDLAQPATVFTGYLFLDVDQDVTTGFAPSELFGLPTQDIGADYFIDMFGTMFGTALIVDGATFEVVAEIPAVVDGSSVRFDLPLAALGGDDGSIDVAVVTGDDSQPTDWVPDDGHGTVEPFRDAPWMSAAPTDGVLAPGESAEVSVTFGGVDPGDYTGDLIVVSDDPRQPQVGVPTTFTVTLPDGFGAVTGTVTNARDGSPLAATVAIDAQRDGSPWPIERAVAADGVYLAYGPAGTWPVTVTADGTQPLVGEVTIPDGAIGTFDAAVQPLWPFATLTGSPVTVEVTTGETATATLELGNVAGLAPLTFEVNELATAPAAGVAAPGPDSTQAAPGATVTPTQARISGNPVLILQDIAPWDTTSLQEALDLNGTAFDIAGSADLPGLDLAAYEVVIVADDQTPAFYTVLEAQIDQLTAYVAGGGFLWYGVAAWGFGGGEPNGLPLPGGTTVLGPVFAESNALADPTHPLVAGMSDPFAGSFASHAAIADLPAGANVIATTPGGDATLAEYAIGSGRLLIHAQPLEFAWQAGEDAAAILANGIPYALGFEPFVDIPWLTAGPAQGSIEAGDTAAITVGIDTTGLEPGTYAATVVIATDDPLNTRFDVPVTVVVTPVALAVVRPA